MGMVCHGSHEPKSVSPGKARNTGPAVDFPSSSSVCCNKWLDSPAVDLISAVSRLKKSLNRIDAVYLKKKRIHAQQKSSPPDMSRCEPCFGHSKYNMILV
jgi:hypothetical protein